jgi:hypothetical protein
VVSIGLLWVVAHITSPSWTRAVAESLVCRTEDVDSVDAVLIDDLDSGPILGDHV